MAYGQRAHAPGAWRRRRHTARPFLPTRTALWMASTPGAGGKETCLKQSTSPRGSDPGEAPDTAAFSLAAREAGASWARRCREGLLQQGRAASGGWPGTLTEARAIATAQLAIWPAGTRRGNDGYGDREAFARLINACARRAWLGSAQKEPPEPPDDGREASDGDDVECDEADEGEGEGRTAEGKGAEETVPPPRAYAAGTSSRGR